MKPGSISLQKRLVWAVVIDVIICAFIFFLFINNPDRLMMAGGAFIFLQLVPLFFLMKDFLVKIVLFRLEKDEQQNNIFQTLKRFDFPCPERLDQLVSQYLRDVIEDAEENSDAAIEAARMEAYLQAAGDMAGAQVHGHLYRAIAGGMNEYYTYLQEE